MDANRLRIFLAATVNDLPALITCSDFAGKVNAFGATQAPPWKAVSSNAITPVLDTNTKTGMAGLCLVADGVFKVKTGVRIEGRSAQCWSIDVHALRMWLHQQGLGPAPEEAAAPAPSPAAAAIVAADAPAPAPAPALAPARSPTVAPAANAPRTQAKG